MGRIVRINDLDTEGLAPYRDTAELSLKAQGIFVAESPKVIRTALDAGYEAVSLLSDEKYITGQAADIVERVGDVPVFSADKKLLEEITGFKLTQGVLCAMKRKTEDSELPAEIHRVAVLEDIMNQTNIGAVFRSAAALGIDAVLLTDGCSDPFFRRTIRVSMGTVFQVPWKFIGRSDSGYIDKLRDMGFVTAAMALRSDTVSIEDERLKSADKLAIVLGTEGDGLKTSTIDECDMTVKIPMAHGVDSLNVAAAGAVAFWEMRYRGDTNA
ncbi:MAG: RNA methyltransferase [Ruminococcus sp.]|uniref:TrmH family RNA methyltransferase n=1 Tax=Ruminococcus sp. TaxID=41978 RepID=UPI0025DD3C2D|nr:RNA methyltransferase [Ruminococcus sp.]MBO4867854.1 RNA methyltransferase [Ruminococcus sp.]